MSIIHNTLYTQVRTIVCEGCDKPGGVIEITVVKTLFL